MAEIVDIYGRPLSSSKLQNEPQTARIASLHSRWEDHPSRGLTPAKLAQIAEQAEQGDLEAQNQLFDDIEEKDGHVFSEMQKRRAGPLQFDWSIEPPHDATEREKKNAALIEQIIRDIPDLEDIILGMMSAVGHGFSCQEIATDNGDSGWYRDGSFWSIRSVLFRPQTWFQVPYDRQNTIHLRDNTPQGSPLQPFGWLTHVHKSKPGHLARGGIHRVLAWLFLFKMFSIRDLSEFLEIYGLPLRVGKYPPGASKDEKSALLRAVMSIGHNAGGIIPQGMEIEFQDAAKGASDPFMAIIQWAEKSQSKVINGQTLSSDIGNVGARAATETHKDIQHEFILVPDTRQLQSSLTRDLVFPITTLNGLLTAGANRCPRWRFDTGETDDLALYADALPKLVNIGMQIPASYAHDKLRIPLPEKGEPILSAGQNSLTPQQPDQTPPVTATAALRRGDREHNPPSDMTALLGRTAEPAFLKMMGPVKELMARASDLGEVRDGLAELFPTMDAQDLAETLTEGMLAAHLAGRDDIEENL